MSLEKKLRDQGYDLIDGPLRSHKELQLWIDKPFDRAGSYKDKISDSFTSSVVLNPSTSVALSVNSTDVEKYNFNIGLTALDDILKALALGSLGLSAVIKSGKSVEISYDNSSVVEYPEGYLADYLTGADLVTANSTFLNHLNRNDILLISGVVYAQNLMAKIETNVNITAEIKAEIEKVLNVNISLGIENNSTLVMKADGLGKVPIAVKAHRLRYRKSRFVDLKLITDNNSPFSHGGKF